MDPIAFKRVLRTFADPATDFLIEKNHLMLQVHGQIHQCNTELIENAVYIVEETGKISATNWILRDLAKIDLLANRIRSMMTPDPLYVFPDLTCDGLENDQYLKSIDNLSTFLKNTSVFSTSVVYITSDAGEGKTSLVNELAIKQSQKFLNRESPFLIVPISLGGRTFHRFDDIVIGALANKFRFPFMNYEAFIEMIKLRIIVPALDGFEEMFVETGSGEALSAMGMLLNRLDSLGTTLISARKAYYEFENLKIQPLLFDVIKDLDVEFFKIAIKRWTSDTLIEFLEKNDIKKSELVYAKITQFIEPDHAVLTRPVLAKKFVSLIKEVELNDILPKLSESGNRSFSFLVESIMTREANEKWIEKTGTDSILKPLLTLVQHYDLLSALALEMWNQKQEYLGQDVVSFVVELYCEGNKIRPEVIRQVKERLKGHALLVVSNNHTSSIEFDHEEFRDYFLARQLKCLLFKYEEANTNKSDLLRAFRLGLLGEKVKSFLLGFMDTKPVDSQAILPVFDYLARIDGHNSYTHENSANILLKILPKLESQSVKHLESYNFGISGLKNIELNNIEFIKCSFGSSSLHATKLTNCKFIECEFECISIKENTIFQNTNFRDCNVVSIEHNGKKYFDPFLISIILQVNKLTDTELEFDYDLFSKTIDNELTQLSKILRYFLRSTHISESVIRKKLGNQIASAFLDDTLPILCRHKIFIEVENKGSGTQSRFKLGQDMNVLEDAIEISQGSFEIFLRMFQ